jgi:site-specific DNA-methyltransferase (adenine-specific)
LDFPQKWRRQDQVHPTQKPVELMEFLVKSYCPENGVVLDNCMGSGSTGIACVNTNRKFIGMELDEKYFKIAEDRISSIIS